MCICEDNVLFFLFCSFNFAHIHFSMYEISFMWEPGICHIRIRRRKTKHRFYSVAMTYDLTLCFPFVYIDAFTITILTIYSNFKANHKKQNEKMVKEWWEQKNTGSLLYYIVRCNIWSLSQLEIDLLKSILN